MYIGIGGAVGGSPGGEEQAVPIQEVVEGQSHQNKTTQDGEMPPHSRGEGKGNAPKGVVGEVEADDHQKKHDRGTQEPPLDQIEDGQGKDVEGDILLKDRLLDSKRGGICKLQDTLPSASHHRAEDDAQHHRSKEDADENQAIQPVEGLRRQGEDGLALGEATGNDDIDGEKQAEEERSCGKEPDPRPEDRLEGSEKPKVVKPKPIGIDAPEHVEREQKGDDDNENEPPFDHGTGAPGKHEVPGGPAKGRKVAVATDIVSHGCFPCLLQPSSGSAVLHGVEQCAWSPPVDNVGDGHPLQGPDTSLQLRNHATVGDP